MRSFKKLFNLFIVCTLAYAVIRLAGTTDATITMVATVTLYLVCNYIVDLQIREDDREKKKSAELHAEERNKRIERKLEQQDLKRMKLENKLQAILAGTYDPDEDPDNEYRRNQND